MKLSKRQIKGLKGSIKKWERIVDGTGVDKGGENCSLCKLYHSECCKSCPVLMLKKGMSNCDETPYIMWAYHHSEMHTRVFGEDGNWWGNRVECPTCKELAQKELDFLKSLLPDKEKGE